MLTVIQTLPALDAGGVERGTLEVAEELVKRGHRSIVVSAGGRMLDDLLATGSEHYRLPVGEKSPRILFQIRKFREILRQTDATILHARSRLPAWAAWLALAGMDPAKRPRFVTTVHGRYRVNRYSRIMARGERVIAISGFIKKYIVESYPQIPAENIRVIPRGVNAADYSPDYRPAAAWLQDWYDRYPRLRGKSLITLPGRITRRKGHEDFLQIMARLRENAALHGLVVGGTSPGKQRYYRELCRYVREKGLESSITFTGHRDDLRDIMSVSTVVMSLSSEPEAFGRTALEALCLGIPVIAWDHGGASEVLNTLSPAGLVPRSDIRRAAETVLHFLVEPPDIRKDNPFTLQRMLDKTIDVYRSLAAVPVNPACH